MNDWYDFMMQSHYLCWVINGKEEFATFCRSSEDC